MLLHLKTCPAGPDFQCPSRFHGCLQTRKLLAHYKRCSEIRKRQSQPNYAIKNPTQTKHACLVCSLVAREARNDLWDRNNRSENETSPTSAAEPPNGIISSFSLPNPQGPIRSRVVEMQNGACQEATQLMPPPPPRQVPVNGLHKSTFPVKALHN